MRSSGREIGSRRETAKEMNGNAARGDESGTLGSKMRGSSSERSFMMVEDPDVGGGEPQALSSDYHFCRIWSWIKWRTTIMNDEIRRYNVCICGMESMDFGGFHFSLFSFPFNTSKFML